MSNKFGYFKLQKRTPKISKERAFGRVIKAYKKDGRSYEYHATKGWRSYRSQ